MRFGKLASGWALTGAPVSMLALAATGGAVAPSVNHHHELGQITAVAQASNPRAYDAALVGFGTCNTVPELNSDARGIGAARDWVFGQILGGCVGCIEVVKPSYVFTGPRIPQSSGVKAVNVVATQRGITGPSLVIVMVAHIDSLNSNAFTSHWRNNTGDSQCVDATEGAALTEAARVLNHCKFPVTLLHPADSGEEQGLYGGRIIVQYASDHWDIEVDLNNDMVGNGHGGAGRGDPDTIRVYSEGTRTNKTLKRVALTRFLGGPSDSSSRNVSRYMAALTDEYLKDFRVRIGYRTDRFGRGGGEEPFLGRGYPAVRLAESYESHNRQHQVVSVKSCVRCVDVIRWADFDYLAT